MSTFKQEVLSILKENENKKVSSIIQLIEELPEKIKKERQKSYILDHDNKPFAVFCYYHKHWELVSETEYGVKNSSKTGLNTMCKLGTNKWTKQQKEAKKAEGQLLNDIMNNKVNIDDADEIKNNIEAERSKIDYTDSVGYTYEEVMEMLDK